jgi:hypothetical protein
MAQDIDKLEQLTDGLQETVKIGEKIMSDGKVDWSDSQYAPELFDAVKKVAESLKEYKELGEEIKDLDGGEALKLLTKILS